MFTCCPCNLVKGAQKLLRKAKEKKRQKLLKCCRAQSGHAYPTGLSNDKTLKHYMDCVGSVLKVGVLPIQNATSNVSSI